MILNGNIAQTLPVIVYDEIKGMIEIKGRSIAVDAHLYFQDFLDYLQKCIQKNPMHMNIILDLEYFNSKTSKIIINFLQIIKTHIVSKGFNANIEWHYDADDDDSKESGEDFKNITALNIILVKKSLFR